MTIFQRVIFRLAILLAASVPMLAQGTYTQIDYPGALRGSTVFAVNTAGDVTGQYEDVNGIYHGFLLSGGTYTTIDYPGATFTYLNGINDVGQIVGDCKGQVAVAFLYDIKSQTFTTISRPHATDTFLSGINNVGTIAGTAFKANGQFSKTIAFELRGSQYRDMVPPNEQDSFSIGVTASDRFVGYIAGPNYFTFLYSNGKYKRSPLSYPNIVSAVNPAGTAFVGYYNSSGTDFGFLYENQTFQTLQFPGSSLTQALGISDSGEVVGYFRDAAGAYHGFIWTPPTHGASSSGQQQSSKALGAQ